MAKHLSYELKKEIQQLKKDGFNAKKISNLKQIPISTIYRILNNKITNKNKKDIENRGRPKKLSDKEKRIIIREVKKNPGISLNNISIYTKNYLNKNICRITAHNLLNQSGYKSYIARKAPFLSSKNIEKRFKFSKNFFCKPIEFWKTVIWSDECKFRLFNNNQKRYWRKSVDEYLIPFTNPTKNYTSASIMVWACFSYNGIGKLVFVEENINSLVYQQILVENLCESARMMDLDKFIFQHDNAPAHSSKLIKRFFDENKIELLSWPAQSPDLNPIENLWAIIGSKIAEKNIYNKKDLKGEIMNIWLNIDKDTLRNLAYSMPNRLMMTISNGGKNIKY